MNINIKKLDHSEKTTNYLISSFRESNKDKIKEHHILRNHIEINDNVHEHDVTFKQKPRILTGRLPAAFDMKAKK